MSSGVLGDGGHDRENEPAATMAELQVLIGTLQREVAELRAASFGGQRPADSVGEGRTGRRQLIMAAGAAALGATVVGLAKATPAAATNGDPVTAGGAVIESSVCTITNSESGSALSLNNFDSFEAALNALNQASGPGVSGSSNHGIGVQGETVTDHMAGVFGADASTNGGFGVSGQSTNGDGVLGNSTKGYGVLAIGGAAPLRLFPAGSAGAPTSGTHALGEVYLDVNGVFYRCVVAGNPGTWLPFNSVVPLAFPSRVLDTRTGFGGLTGPFVPDGITHTTSVLTGGLTGIPDGAVGLVGNVAITGNGSLLNGDGYLSLFPGGQSNPGTASLNAGAGAYATSNGVTIGLGTGLDAGELSFSWQGGGSPLPCQVILDVTAYIM